jgi:hypothetical protein
MSKETESSGEGNKSSLVKPDTGNTDPARKKKCNNSDKSSEKEFNIDKFGFIQLIL